MSILLTKEIFIKKIYTFNKAGILFVNKMIKEKYSKKWFAKKNGTLGKVFVIFQA
jgi:hypothetical protein